MKKRIKKFFIKIPESKKDLYENQFRQYLSDIISEILYDLSILDEDLKKYYEKTLRELFEKGMSMGDIVGTKKDISFEELCQLYNGFIFEYEFFLNEIGAKEHDNKCEYLNKRVSWYHLKLEMLNDIFVIETYKK